MRQFHLPPVGPGASDGDARSLPRFGARAGGARLAAALVLAWTPAAAFAGETGPGFRAELGLAGGVLDFLASYPFVLLFATLALGTALGRAKLGFLSLGSTAGTLLVGISISLWAYLAFGIRYAVPGLVVTVFLNLFMFAVGLKVGPQFLAGLRKDGARGVAIALVVVVLNFAIALAGARLFDLAPGFAPGLISGSMTDTAVVGVATGAIEGGVYRPPGGLTPDDVAGNVAAAYAVTYLFSLIAIVLLIRYLPRWLGVDAVGAARAAEHDYGADEGHTPPAGTEAAYTLARSVIDVRAFRIEADVAEGLTVREFSARAAVPVLQVLRDGEALDLTANPTVRRGDVATVVGEVTRLVERGREIGPEIADLQARDVELEVADLVVTRKEIVGRTLRDASDHVRRTLAAGGSPAGRLFHPVALLRGGSPIPVWPDLPLARGDVLRIVGRRSDADAAGKLVGATLRATKDSDILTLSAGLAVGFVAGTLHFTVGRIPFGLGAPAGVMLAGIALSLLRARYPLLGGPVSEGARSLLQALGLDVFIAVTALNAAASVAGAFTGGYVGRLLAIGMVAGLVPPLVAWWVGRRIFRMNAAILLGTICGSRHSTPALRVAQEVAASAVPAVGYPVAYAVSSVAVLVLGYLALFL
jgi:putative transport protein